LCVLQLFGIGCEGKVYLKGVLNLFFLYYVLKNVYKPYKGVATWEIKILQKNLLFPIIYYKLQLLLSKLFVEFTFNILLFLLLDGF